MKNEHPTKRTLIAVTVAMMDEMPAEHIKSEEVLERSGISKGSLYHHFKDFSELIEAAQVYRFGHTVDGAIDGLNALGAEAKSRDEFVEGVKFLARFQQSDALKERRLEQVADLGAATKNPRMREALGQEQERLTEALADLFREGINRGWANPNFDPRAAAVLAQTLTMGKVVDDITPNHMDPEKWSEIVDLILELVVFPPNLQGEMP